MQAPSKQPKNNDGKHFNFWCLLEVDVLKLSDYKKKLTARDTVAMETKNKRTFSFWFSLKLRNTWFLKADDELEPATSRRFTDS